MVMVIFLDTRPNTAQDHLPTDSDHHDLHTPTSAIEVPSRFARTLREVIADDYMPEILALQKRLEKLDRTLDGELQKKQPVVQYMPLDDDDRLADMLRHLSENHREFGVRLSDIEADLQDFIDSSGVCSSFHLFLLFSLTSFFYLWQPVSLI